MMGAAASRSRIASIRRRGQGGEWPDSIKTIMTDKPAAEGGDGREIGIGDNQPGRATIRLIELRDAGLKIHRPGAGGSRQGGKAVRTWGLNGR